MLADDFLADLIAAGRSNTTIKQYTWHLQQFITWLGDKPINRQTLRQWRSDIANRWQPSTQKTAIVVVKSYIDFLREEGEQIDDLGKYLKTPRIPRKTQRTLTRNEIEKLLRQCDSTPKGVRDRAIITLLTDSGLRSAELRRLTIDNLNLKAGTLTVKRKGGNVGQAYFGHTTARHLKQWLRVRGDKNHQVVFVSVGGSTPGEPLTSRGLRSILKKIGEQAGIKGVSPHAFRRSFATLLIEAGAPSRLVQEMGGWSDLRQVERYTRALETRRLAQNYSPIDRIQPTHQLTLWQ